ncbi:hypothetical protein CROQUDRAFT_664448 [Cronartium quercuum f. sp. fusiforme G11]|uniref:Uncharacterized protein n=1 Tax=Cronartium quercuum f. sp. fusiforme G11 TaxID=708437 RepID=A0A9P6T6G6_9BASI|nr:hypothetical protein CROQUDRAFT_664448 [Cronartium quercuum f. sp. fusiforme G11]
MSELELIALCLSILSFHGPAWACVPWPCSWLADPHFIQPITVSWTSTTSVVPPTEISNVSMKFLDLKLRYNIF